MSEGLSIEEILKQAEEIRKKAEKTAKTAVEETNAAADEFKTRELKIPKDTEAPTVRKLSILLMLLWMKQYILLCIV